MTLKFGEILTAVVLLTAANVALQAEAASTNHDFSAYPAPIYKGSAVQPRFQGSQRSYHDYRTRIRASVAQGPAFAGHYAVAVIGCGTSCRFGFITDLKTGLVYDLPNAGEEYYQVLYRLHPDSRLIETQWQPAEAEGKSDACHLEDFVWTGQAFKSLGQRTQAACPEWNDFAD